MHLVVVLAETWRVESERGRQTLLSSLSPISSPQLTLNLGLCRLFGLHKLSTHLPLPLLSLVLAALSQPAASAVVSNSHNQAL